MHGGENHSKARLGTYPDEPKASVFFQEQDSSILQCRKKGTACQKALVAEGLGDRLELGNLGAPSWIIAMWFFLQVTISWVKHCPKGCLCLTCWQGSAAASKSQCRKSSGGSTFHMLPHCLLSLLCPDVCHCRLGCTKIERGLQLPCVSPWFCHVELLSHLMLWLFCVAWAFKNVIHQASGCKALRWSNHLYLLLSSSYIARACEEQNLLFN